VADKKVDETTFCSQHEQNLPKPAFANDCEWASCSLMAYDETEPDPLRRARDFSRLKSLRRKYRYFAKVELSADSGVVACDTKKIHYQLWAFKHSPEPLVMGFEEAANDDG